MYGIIDIGSNTMRLNVYEVNGDAFKTVFHRKSTAGLAGYVSESGKLRRSGILRAIETLVDFQETLNSLSIHDVYAFGTAALRNVSNTDQAIRTIRKITGISVDVLSGEEEAKLDYLGATWFMPMNEGLLIDIGGGSTELVTFRGGKRVEAFSLPIGSLNMYITYVARILPDKGEAKRIRRHVIKSLKEYKIKDETYPMICGLGGTVRAAHQFISRNRNACQKDLKNRDDKIELEELHRATSVLQGSDKETLLPILRSAPDRIHTLLPGMIILDTIAQKYGSKELIISNYGVREGYLLSRVLKRTE